MNEVEALLSASERFLAPLRLNEGFSEQAYAALVAAMRDFAHAWQGTQLIPRLAASVLVDLIPVMEPMADAYQEPGDSEHRNRNRSDLAATSSGHQQRT